MNEQTPYEAWKGEKPNIGQVKVFGCLVNMKDPGTHTRKMEDMSKVLVSLGNEPGTKSYRLYDPEKDCILVSRDVIFEEGKTWKWSKDQQGIEVKQEKDFIELRRTGYARKVLEKAGMGECNPTKYPMAPKEHITKDEGRTLIDPTEYKSMVGGLRYLVHTHPNIAYVVGIVSRFIEKTTVKHKHVVKRIFGWKPKPTDWVLVEGHPRKINAIRPSVNQTEVTALGALQTLEDITKLSTNSIPKMLHVNVH
ncbi:hypothetical protein AgCh_022844 [Apium graveolens]